MKFKELEGKVPEKLFNILVKEIDDLRPCQQKAVKAGLLEGKNLLVCTPTASGKTLVAEIAAIKNILENKGKAVYIVPLKALAREKYKDFKQRYGHFCRVALSIGDMDKSDSYLSDFDLIITTSEKLDSLIRHRAPWVSKIGTVIVDEVHLLNDPGRGPTLEITLTILKKILKAQTIALSATIGNPKELAQWLEAKLIEDNWRPVELKKGIYFDGQVEFY
ncbi:DEAD/DEAH box helicase [Candidatus Woesearchaeota archaeon]|nr:DEAD/DEAH box helicase [Candidatus Woesearchaeota archaeon]